MKSEEPAPPCTLGARQGCRFLTRCLFSGIGLAHLLLICDAARAALIGYHDVSNPVKTSGWVCDTANPAPVRVYLYAQTSAGLKLLDSQLADKRRVDLLGVCGGTDHAFRFADYAANGEGISLLGAAGSVPMYVYVDSPSGLVALGGSPHSVSFAPAGLWDPGLKSGRWRTDLDNPDEGTVSAPLLLGECPYTTPQSDGYTSFSGGGYDGLTGCRYGSMIFPRSNAASSDGTWPRSSFWTVVANVEDAMENPLCVNGPPGQSLPLGAPGDGEVFGVAALPDVETGNPGRVKVHLALNSQNWAACRNGSYGGPYLAFAAQAERGNDGVLTYLNLEGAPTVLRFGLTLMDLASESPALYGAPVGAKRYSQGHVLIEALWGGIKRWLFIELVPDERFLGPAVDGYGDTHVRFNWHLVNSMLYPGADYLYKSGAVISAECAGEGVAIPVLDRGATFVNPATRDRSRREYSIDLQRVFECLQRRNEWGAAAAMPNYPLPVTGVFFGIEQDDHFYLDGVFTGVVAPNKLWIAVDSVRIE